MISFDLLNRHPLQQMVVDIFVPNDAHLVGGIGTGSIVDSSRGEKSLADGETKSNSVVVCTGANACGKVKPSSPCRSALSFYLHPECLFKTGTVKHVQ